MRAVRIEGPRRVATLDVPDPEATAGEVSVRVRAAAICATDRRLATHGTPTPRIPGHEVAGLLEDQGASGVDHKDTLAAGVDHDAGLLGQLGGAEAVGEHEETTGFQAEFPGGLKVLEGDIRLGAVGGHPYHRGPALLGFLEVGDGAHPGQQQQH